MLAGLTFTRNMLHRKSFILNPLVNRILLKYNVGGALCGHIVRPPNTCLIVVVESSSSIKIVQVVSELSHAMTEMSDIDSLL